MAKTHKYLTIREAIAETVRARKAQGISAKSIAEEANVHPVSLSRYLTGTKDIGSETASRLLTVLAIRLV